MTRTLDLLITNQLLYRLSYASNFCRARTFYHSRIFPSMPENSLFLITKCNILCSALLPLPIFKGNSIFIHILSFLRGNFTFPLHYFHHVLLHIMQFNNYSSNSYQHFQQVCQQFFAFYPLPICIFFSNSPCERLFVTKWKNFLFT